MKVNLFINIKYNKNLRVINYLRKIKRTYIIINYIKRGDLFSLFFYKKNFTCILFYY